MIDPADEGGAPRSPVVVVTGGRGGIGSQVVARLVTAGFRVVSIDKSETADNAGFDADGVWKIRADLHVDKVIQRVFEQVSDFGDRLHGLVYAAGSFQRGTLATTDLAAWRTALDDHLIDPALCAGRAVQSMQGGGRLVFIGSISAREALPDQAAYASAKAGLAALVRSINVDHGPVGIRATLFVLGAVHTAAWGPKPVFDPSRMLQPGAVADEIVRVLLLPLSVRVDEMVLMPPEGVLR